MSVSRRFFIGGVASFGAFGGCRFRSCSVLDACASPDLTLGVLSDIHVQCGVGAGADKGIWWKTTQWLESALEWFRGNSVDAVVLAGDLADQGLGEQLQAVADAWFKVFPDDRRPDGRKVERIFVTGNHDWNGWHYNSLSKRRFPDEAERSRNVMLNDYGGWWERVFHERYEPIYMKEVNGYQFVGSHWDGRDSPRGEEDPVAAYSRIETFLSARKGLIDPTRPFFYVQHPHLKDTCYGPWAWGHDNGDATRVLSSFQNAIAISGHSHYSLADERSLWQGPFTSIGASSLSFTGLPGDEFAPRGYENSIAAERRLDDEKTMPTYSVGAIEGGNLYGDSRQGLLLRVYSDSIVVERRDFVSRCKVGPDWIMPLPTSESGPFAFANRAKRMSAPEFPVGAKLVVKTVRAHSRGGQEHDALSVLIPAVRKDGDARVKRFEVSVENGGSRVVRTVLASGFHLPLGHKRVSERTECIFALGKIKIGNAKVSVTPIGWFERRGKPLVSQL